jgi:hypothetical protein
MKNPIAATNTEPEPAVQQTPRTIPGVPVEMIPAFAIGPLGGVLHLREVDGTKLPHVRPVAAPPGSLVLIVPPPASEHLARAMGILGANGQIVTTKV